MKQIKIILGIILAALMIGCASPQSPTPTTVPTIAPIPTVATTVPPIISATPAPIVTATIPPISVPAVTGACRLPDNYKFKINYPKSFWIFSLNFEEYDSAGMPVACIQVYYGAPGKLFNPSGLTYKNIHQTDKPIASYKFGCKVITVKGGAINFKFGKATFENNTRGENFIKCSYDIPELHKILNQSPGQAYWDEKLNDFAISAGITHTLNVSGLAPIVYYHPTKVNNERDIGLFVGYTGVTNGNADHAISCYNTVLGQLHGCHDGEISFAATPMAHSALPTYFSQFEFENRQLNFKHTNLDLTRTFQSTNGRLSNVTTTHLPGDRILVQAGGPTEFYIGGLEDQNVQRTYANIFKKTCGLTQLTPRLNCDVLRGFNGEMSIVIVDPSGDGDG